MARAEHAELELQQPLRAVRPRAGAAGLSVEERVSGAEYAQIRDEISDVDGQLRAARATLREVGDAEKQEHDKLIGAERDLQHGRTALAAALAEVGAQAVALEPYAHGDLRPLLDVARARFEKLGLHNVVSRHGDGLKGWPEQAPFDRVIVTAAAPDVPGHLLECLGPEGVLVAPVGHEREEQQLLRVRRKSDSFDIEDLGKVRFVPLVAGLPRPHRREAKA